MTFVDSMFRGARMLAADATGNAAAYDDFWYESMGGKSSAAGMRVSPETSKKLGVVIACVSSRGKTMAMLPFRVRRDLKGGGSEVIAAHPVWRLIAQRPNRWQTPFDFRLMMNAHFDLRGNAYAEKFGNVEGYPEELLPMHPDRVRVEVAPKTGRLIYVYNDPLLNAERRLVQEEVFHLRDWSDNGYTGQSRIAMALDPFGVALARQDYMARWFKNDARTGLVFTGGQFKSDEARDAWIDKMRSGGVGANRGKPMWVPTGMTANQLGVTPVDSQLIEGKKVSDQEICSIIGEYPHVVGIDAGKAATYASVEQFNIMRAQNVAHPMAVMWEQAIQRDLLLDPERYGKFSLAYLMRGDNLSRAQYLSIALGSTGPAWMVPDEARELDDMNPLPDGIGKTAWRSTNLAPLAQLENPSQKQAQASPDDAQEEEDGGAGQEGSQAQFSPAQVARFEMMALASAERCVRREVAEAGRLIERAASAGEVADFYAAHVRFIVEVFRLNGTAVLKVQAACDDRGLQLATLLAEDDDDAARQFVAEIAATEPAKLAKLAVEGM